MKYLLTFIGVQLILHNYQGHSFKVEYLNIKEISKNSSLNKTYVIFHNPIPCNNDTNDLRYQIRSNCFVQESLEEIKNLISAEKFQEAFEDKLK